jgi:predicted nuclease of predicted toxin-antitoxin system
MPNGEIFEKALSEDRIILTSDLDFGEIAAALKDTLGKVLLLRLHNMRAANVIRRLTTVLPRVEGELAAGAVVIVEKARHRVRPLPIGRTSEPT